MTGFGAGEYFGEFRDNSRAQGTETYDYGQYEPEGGKLCRYSGIGSQEHIADHKGNYYGEDGGDPYQTGQRLFKIQILHLRILGLAHASIDIEGYHGGNHHENPHDEDPGKQSRLQGRGYRQDDESNQGHSGNPVGLKAVGGGSYAVTGVISGTVGNNSRVAGIVFFDAENDLHQVGTDVGYLGKYTAGNTQGAGPQGFTHGKTDKTCSRQFPGNKEQDDQHHDQLHADQEQTDAHAGIQSYIQYLERFAGKAGKSRSAVGQGIHADTVPGYAVGTENTDYGPHQDEQYPAHRHLLQEAEVEGYTHADKGKEDGQEFTLLNQVGLAGFIDGIGYIQHCRMGLQFFYFVELV